MKKILILGGGFGGVYCAKRLQKMRLNSFDIELISDNNYFVFQPLLPEALQVQFQLLMRLHQ